mgnify:CR=1 FL=1
MTEQSAATRTCRTFILHDVPASHDPTFVDPPGRDVDRHLMVPPAIQPHQRVAHAVARQIRDDPKHGVIGLEGPWGSGKSTVVELLRDELLHRKASDEQPEVVIRFCCFDAWSSQADPLRHAFMHSMIDQLGRQARAAAPPPEDKPLRTEVQRAALERLAGVPETTNTRATSLTAMVGVLALLVPPAIVLGTATDRDGGHFLAALALASAPFLAVLVSLAALAVVRLARFVSRSSRTGRSHNSNRRDRWTWGSVSDSSTTSLRRLTSHEFTEQFRTFVRELGASIQRSEQRPLLSKARPHEPPSVGCRFVIVLDNLDRVGDETARLAWTTLHSTFMGTTGEADDDTLNGVWFVVPYDSRSADRWWASTPRLDGRGTASGYLDKLLTVRHAVPPLLPFDWIEHLRTLLSHAMPDHQLSTEPAELPVDAIRGTVGLAAAGGDACRWSGIVRLAVAHWNDAQPSPRDLRQLVNAVGALHITWCGEYPLEHIAYYALHCRDRSREQLMDWLLQPDTQVNLLQSLDSRAAVSICGLAHGVPPSESKRLMLIPEIRRALRNRNADALAKLKESHGAAFGSAFDYVMAHLAPEALLASAQAGFDAIDRDIVSRKAFLNQVTAAKAGSPEAIAAAMGKDALWDNAMTFLERAPLSLALATMQSVSTVIERQSHEDSDSTIGRRLRQMLKVIEQRGDIDETARIRIPEPVEAIDRIMTSLVTNASDIRLVRWLHLDTSESSLEHLVAASSADSATDPCARVACLLDPSRLEGDMLGMTWDPDAVIYPSEEDLRSPRGSANRLVRTLLLARSRPEMTAMADGHLRAIAHSYRPIALRSRGAILLACTLYGSAGWTDERDSNSYVLRPPDSLHAAPGLWSTFTHLAHDYDLHDLVLERLVEAITNTDARSQVATWACEYLRDTLLRRANRDAVFTSARLATYGAALRELAASPGLAAELQLDEAVVGQLAQLSEG